MPDLQSTNRTKVSKVREASFGVIPASPAFKAQRSTSSSLSPDIQTVVSDEIRSDRQVTDLILVGQAAKGSLPGELSFQTFDDDFEEALQSTWTSQPNISVLTSDTEISDVSATTLTTAAGLGTPFKTGHLTLVSGMTTSANNKLARVSSSTSTSIVYPAATFTAQAVVNVGTAVRVVGFEGASGDIVATVTGGNALTSTALDFTTLGIAVGDWVKIGDGVAGNSFATTAINGWCRVSAVAANRLSFDIVPAGFGADAGTGKTIRVFFGDRIRNGSTKVSSTIERQYLDHSPVSYEYFTGMTLGSMGLSLDPKTIVKVSREYLGSSGSIQASRVAGATDIAAPTTDVMNTSANVADISVGGATVTGPNFVTKFSININNNLGSQDAIGAIGAVGIRNGEFGVSGDLETYFGTPAQYQAVLANTTTSVQARVTAPTTNKESYLFDVPAIEYASGSPEISGKNSDVKLSGSYQAKMHATLGYTMGINRFWFLP